MSQKKLFAYIKLIVFSKINRKKAVSDKAVEKDDNVLWRTASDTDLVAAGQSIRWDSPILKHSNETEDQKVHL